MSLQEALEKLAREAPQRRKEEVIDAVKQVQAAHFERAAQYTNIIIAGGYAGAFAVWSLVGDLLSRTQRAWVALLLLVSLLVFVMWEVTKMIVLGAIALQFSKLASADPMTIPQVLNQQSATMTGMEHRLGLIWARFVLPVTIGAALGAAGILGFAFVRQIVCG